MEFGAGMSLQHREDKRFSKEPAMRTELAMAGSPVMIRAVRPDGSQEMQMGSTSDMEPQALNACSITCLHAVVTWTKPI